MGVKISSKNIFSAPKFDLTFQAIPGRDGELITSNNRFPNTTVSYTCFIPAKSIQELSEKVTAVKAWLYAQPDRYHTLTDTYDAIFFRKAGLAKGSICAPKDHLPTKLHAYHQGSYP